MEEQIKQRIEELTKARDAFVAEANQRVAAYNGAIGELTALITQPAQPEPVQFSGEVEEAQGAAA